MTWPLSKDWNMTRDKHNWILQARKGNRWRADSYYRTPEQLLKSLHETISRTIPADPDLLRHLETAYKAGEALSDKLYAHVHATYGGLANLSPQRAAAIAKLEETNYAS